MLCRYTTCQKGVKGLERVFKLREVGMLWRKTNVEARYFNTRLKCTS